ncbi:hypothetical protein HAL013_05380 [Helicobacter ailurogastricus]|uniref:Uncharacterized protein n=1 Tax=Helicobacter ailurogastricus TaxID=1578720 RepID=A0A0K2XG86_9HELI|nr:hypothetical protein HAL011_07550 [Helicobacter ailurogastricus]CRF42368.1 hypothetical protein HAL013_05380 [Helicobacter ailurogastricus]CRF44623.1 hypothetical protein HAL09_12170 [Helicobacter ailurogastricus]
MDFSLGCSCRGCAHTAKDVLEHPHIKIFLGFEGVDKKFKGCACGDFLFKKVY